MKIGNRVVAEFRTPGPGEISPGSLALCCDPNGISGPDRERVVAEVVRLAGLDPKTDYEGLYRSLWRGE